MNDSWSTFLALVKAGLWEQEACLPAPPDADGWEQIRSFAREQAVQGLLLRGISHLSARQLPPPAWRMRLMQEVDDIVRTNARMAQVEAALLEQFRADGTEVLVIKGSRLARFYAHPETRSSGDIDLYVPHFQRALDLFPQASPTPDGSALVAVDGVTIDLHRRYYDLHVPQDRLPAPGSVCGELLLTGAHIMKHAVGVGVGLKQLCDMAIGLDRCWGSYQPGELEQAVRRSGMGRFWPLLCSLLVQELGLAPEKCGPSFREVNPAPLMRIVRRGGNFGTAHPARRQAVQKGGRHSKLSTALAFAARLPFSLWYAPKETSSTIAELVKGNL